MMAHACGRLRLEPDRSARSHETRRPAVTYSWLNETTLVVAVCAVLSALVAKLLRLGFRGNHLGIALLWMMLFPVTLVVAFVFVLPEVRHYRSRAFADRYISDDPLLSVVSNLDSVAARHLHGVMASLVEEGYASQTARRMAFRRSFSILMPVFDASVPVAADEALRRYLLAQLAVMRELRGRPGAPCYWLATGSPDPDGSTFNGVSDVRLEDLNLAMAGVLVSARDAPVAPTPRDELTACGEELFDRVKARLGPEFEETLALLRQSGLTDADYERIAGALIELYGETLRLPSPLRDCATRALLTR